MAKIAPTVAPAIASVSTARMTGTHVAGAGRIEEVSGSNALSFEAAQFGFEGAPGNNLEQRPKFSQDGSRNPNLGKGRFSATNETFTAIVESELTIDGGRGHGEDGSPKNFAGMVSRAIATYELNAQVIHGTLPRLGTSLSMRL